VAGSIWASVEIILGSFFHNLNLPFSGTILSFIGVYLMISFFQVWKERGLIWRAGIICALMKSISPSAIILGPMIGIMTEALVMELFILLLGKNLLGYMTGGAFAVFSTIVHKFFNLLITYGFNFINILDSLYHFCIKQMHIEGWRPRTMILLISCIYVAAGTVAAILGYRAGKKYLQTKTPADAASGLTSGKSPGHFDATYRHDFSLYFLALNIVAIVTSLVLLNYELIIPASFIAVTYLVFCFLRYKSALRRLKKVSVWIQFFLITLVASFLWIGIADHTFFSMDGFFIGLKMNFRAVVILVGFSAISVELRNPIIKSLLYRRGFASLYQSLGLAFSAMPEILSSAPDKGKSHRKWIFSNTTLFSRASRLLLQFEKEHLTRPDVLIITGDIQQGKTSFARKIVDRLKKRGRTVEGFLAPAVHEENIRVGFDLLDLKTGSSHKLCRTTKRDDWQRQGMFYFDPEGVITGKEILLKVAGDSPEIAVIDEIGPMELNNQGWASPIETLCRQRHTLLIWVVRRSLVEVITRKWNVGTVYIADISKDNADTIADKIEEILHEHHAQS
jgi:nucleoside-triphosphatase THEP1